MKTIINNPLIFLITTAICILEVMPAFPQRQIIRLSHHVNTGSSEYFPCLNANGTKIYFTGMDRTGFFDVRIDYTKTKNGGGEDIFTSSLENGLWTDARSIPDLNTDAHEAVTQVLADGSLMITGNYPENLGPTNDRNGSATPDIFMAKPAGKGFQIIHFSEPVNSIFFDSDGWMNDSGNIILFSSDRPGRVGSFHKKGWSWNGNNWGNTDIWVSVKSGDLWAPPVNLGPKVNTPFAERTPWLSKDGLRICIASNGHNGRKDLDVVCFDRKTTDNWTTWSEAVPMADVNTPLDDWAYREYNGIGYFARSVKLGFTPTNRYHSGAGTPFENNFRQGYVVTGAQSGTFNSDEQTDLFMVLDAKKPAITLSDILFDYNKATIKSGQAAVIARIIDLVRINSPSGILIEGHTDVTGTADRNLSRVWLPQIP